jgi:adenine/guanine phosphoribosyltransferase-like PRPP-binding protein
VETISYNDVASDYLHALFVPKTQVEIIDRMAKDVERSGVNAEAIVFTGLSGAMVAIPLGLALELPVVAVRKHDDRSSHSAYKIEGYRHFKRYIIADDFVASGRTVSRIIKGIKEWNYQAENVGFIGMRQHKTMESLSYPVNPDEPTLVWGKIRNLGHEIQGNAPEREIREDF